MTQKVERQRDFEKKQKKARKMIREIAKEKEVRRRDFQEEALLARESVFSKELILILKNESTGYLEFLMTPFHEDAQETYFKRLELDPRLEFIALECLEDLNLCALYFSKEQASVRVLALDYLKWKARKGNLELLESMTKKMLIDSDERRFYGGGIEDIIELTVTWLELTGKKKINKEPSLIFQVFPYEEKNHDIFARSLAYLFPKAVWQKDLSRHFLEAFEYERRK